MAGKEIVRTGLVKEGDVKEGHVSGFPDATRYISVDTGIF